MKAVTYQEFVQCLPVWQYDDADMERFAGYWAGGKALTALDVLGMDELSVEEKLNLVFCPPFLESRLLHEFGCRVAEWLLDGYAVDCKACWNAIDMKRKWLNGCVPDVELESAKDAAAAEVEILKQEFGVSIWTAARAAVWASKDHVSAARQATYEAVLLFEWEARRSVVWGPGDDEASVLAAMNAALEKAASEANQLRVDILKGLIVENL